MGVTGLETPAELSGETGIPARCGTQSGTLAPELARVVDAWPTLAESTRRAILALASQGEQAAVE